MPVYTTSEASFAKIRQKLIKRSLLNSSILLIFLLGVETWRYYTQGVVEFSNIIIGIFVTSVLSAIAINKALKEQKEIWNSVEIKLEEDYISRQQLRIPEVIINREEIIAIQESKQGLSIISQDKTRSLLITVELNRADYLEIKDFLSNWIEIKPLSTTQKAKNFSIVALYSILFVGLIFSP